MRFLLLSVFALNLLVLPSCSKNSSQSSSNSNSSSETKTGGDDSGAGSVGCKIGDATVAEGMHGCDKNVLYQCADSANKEVKNCNQCKRTGAGSGSKYSTSCKADSQRPDSWPEDKVFKGPGCYFGFAQSCGGSSGQCSTDCDCGRCGYCESGTCRHGGEGPYGCFRGCSA